jgi:hypothetical protein
VLKDVIAIENKLSYIIFDSALCNWFTGLVLIMKCFERSLLKFSKSLGTNPSYICRGGSGPGPLSNPIPVSGGCHTQ